MDMRQQGCINEAAEKFTEALVESYRSVSERGMAAQEQNAQLTEEFFNTVIKELRSQVEENRQLTQQLSDQQQRQREATQALTQETLNAYMDFVNSIFSYWQGSNAERAEEQTGRVGRKAASTERSKEAIRLLNEWLADESGYDEETWPQLKAALERDRPSNRKLFVD